MFTGKYLPFFILSLFVFSCGNPNQEAVEHTRDQVDSVLKAEKKTPANETLSAETDNEEPAQAVYCEYNNQVTSLGMGLLLMPGKCKFYNNKALTDLYMEWDLSENYDPPQLACALYYKPDYGIAHYVCLDSTEKYYHILINGNQEKYVPRIYGKIFENWPTYIFGSIGGINLPMNEEEGYYIHMTPLETADKMAVQVNAFCPLDVQGDWVKVKLDCYTFDEKSAEDCHLYIDECKSTPVGWIRWRKGNKILIGIHQLV